MTEIKFYIEYDWMVGVYRFRIGQSFTDFQNVRSLPSRKEWREFLKPHGFKLGRKTDSRTWEIVRIP